MSANVINTLQEEEEEVRSLLLRHQKRIMLDLSSTDLITVLVKNSVLTDLEADVLLQPYALSENALLSPDATSNNTKRVLRAVVSDTSSISTNSNSNTNSSNSAVNYSDAIGDSTNAKTSTQLILADNRNCSSPNPYEKIEDAYAAKDEFDESKLLQTQCSNLINIIAKSGFEKFKQFCYAIESECPQLIDDLINDRLKRDDEPEVEEKITEKENPTIDSLNKEEDNNAATLPRVAAHSPHPYPVNESKHPPTLSLNQPQNAEQPAVINPSMIMSKFPQSEFNLMQKNDSNAILIAPSQYQAKNFQANTQSASSECNYSSLLCHSKSTTSPLSTRKREKLLHRFSDAATLGRKLKRKKNSRTCRSMTEPIEILADPVIEDEFFGDRTTWEYHTVSITRVPTLGFGIAVSGGRDNPNFVSGDTSITVSDVLRNGPAEDRLQVNDRIISVNGVSLENVEYATAIQVLRDSGNTVTLVLKRRVNCSTMATNFSSTVGVGVNSIPLSNSNFAASTTNSTNATQPNSLNSSFALGNSNSQPIKVTLTKNSKKDDYGIVIGCRLFIKEITSKARDQLSSNGYTLQEGDTITRIHNTNCGDTMSLKEAKKIIDGCKERLNLVVLRDITNQSSNSNLFNADASAQRSVYNHHQQVSNCTNNLDGSYANGGNSYSSQNLYVQPPSRLMANGTGNALNDEKNNLTPRGRSRGPIIDNLALQQLDRPSTPLSAARNRLEGPQRPPPLKGATNDNEDSFYSSRRQLYADDSLSRRRQSLEPRFISFQKEGSVGIRLTGGNEAGIFVTAVQPGSPASLQGLMPGDKILKVNDMDMHGVTREEAVLFLLSLQDRIDLIVQYRKADYDEVVNNHHGDSFHIKTHFHCESPLKGEIAFKAGDVFRVIDTLHNGVVGSWQVLKIGHGHQEMQRGVIPNKARAEELATAQFNASKKEMSANESRGNFFRRRKSTHRRSKSLSRENWDDVVFSDSISKFPAYERVVLRHPGFVRPVVIFGPISDLAREKLAKEFPDKFSIPLQSDEIKNSKCRIVRLSNIRDIMDSGKHALLDITPNAVDRLNYAQFYPIVVFLKTESKHVIKQLRHGIPKSAHKSSKKLLEQCQKLDQIWSHIFSAQILLNDEDTWYRKLREAIDIQQSGAAWMSEAKPIESLSDDFLFPMTTSRLSYASSPESDLELSPGPSTSLPLGNLPQLVKSNSDPSIATNQDILDRDRHILGDGLPPPYTNPYDPVGNQSLHHSGNIDGAVSANANAIRSQSIYGMNAPDLPPRIDRQSKPGSGEVLPIASNHANNAMGRLAPPAQEQRAFDKHMIAENPEADYITRNVSNTTANVSAGHDTMERHHTSLERQARINAAQLKMAISNLSSSQPANSYDSASNYESYNTAQLTAQNLGRLGPNAPDDLKSVPNTSSASRPAANIEMNIQQQQEYGRTTHEHRQSFAAHGDMKRQSSPIRPSFHEKNSSRTIDPVGGQRPTNLILEGSPRKMETKTDYGKYSNRSNSTSQADYGKVPKNSSGSGGHLLVTPPNGSSGSNTMNSGNSSMPFKPVPPPKPKNYKPPLPNANNGKSISQWEKNESVSPCSPQGFYYSSSSGHHHYAPQTPSTPHHSHASNPANIPPKYAANNSYGPPTIPHHPSASNYSSNASSSHHYNGGSGTGPYIAPHRAVPPTLVNMQPHTPERNALDLAGSREQRGSAFELYRKPQIDTSTHHNIMSNMEGYHHIPQYRQNALYDDAMTSHNQRHFLPPASLPLMQQPVNAANYLPRMPNASELTQQQNYRYNDAYTDLSSNNKDSQFTGHNVDNTSAGEMPPLPPLKSKKKSVIKGSFNVIKNALIKTTRPLRRLNSLKGAEHKTKYLRRQHSMLERSLPKPMYPSDYPVYPLHLIQPSDAALHNEFYYRQYNNQPHHENPLMNSANIPPAHYRNTHHHYGNHLNSTYQNLENEDIYGYMDPISGMATARQDGYFYDSDHLYANRARIDLERKQAEALKFTGSGHGKKIFRRHSTTTADRTYLYKTEPPIAFGNNYPAANVGQSRQMDIAPFDRCLAPNSEILTRRSFRLDLRNSEPVYQSRREMQLNHLQQTKMEMKERILQGKRDIERDLTHHMNNEYDSHYKESMYPIRREREETIQPTTEYADQMYPTRNNETVRSFNEATNSGTGRPAPIYESREESILQTEENEIEEKEDKDKANVTTRIEKNDSSQTIIENVSGDSNTNSNRNSENINQVLEASGQTNDNSGEHNLDNETVHDFDESNMPTILENEDNSMRMNMRPKASSDTSNTPADELKLLPTDIPSRTIIPAMPTMPSIDENDSNFTDYPTTSHKLPSAVNVRKMKTGNTEASHMQRNDSNASVETQYTSQASLPVGPPNATSTPYTSNMSLPLAGPVNLTSQFTAKSKSSATSGFPSVPKEPSTTRGYFDSNGGTLVDNLWNVSLIIPPAAIPPGVKQEIYFTVSDPRMGQAVNGPPLDMENGETMLSPLVMCGPQGLEFLKPVTLNIPHCAGHTPSLGVALKATDSEKNLHTEWENMDLPSNADAHTVSVNVDHF